jgi:probable HAF family extracellular repeat protein
MSHNDRTRPRQPSARPSLATGLRALGLGALALLLSVGVTGRAAAEPYTIEDLGIPAGDPISSSSTANSINASGQVAGTVNEVYGPGVMMRAFLSSAAGILDLGVLGQPSDFSQGNGINASGLVVGRSGGGGHEHAFLYDQGMMRDLGTLGGRSSEATAINDTGQVVGTAMLHHPNPLDGSDWYIHGFCIATA